MINKVKLVQLHEPLFLTGCDLGKKLVEKHSKGTLSLGHDTDSDHVIVEFKGERAHVKNWASFNEDIGDKTVQPEVKSHPITTGVAVKAQIGGPMSAFTAQVETPMDKIQQPPKKRAKYQGEESQGE